jgi:short-subunit dehydrogenase
LKKHNVAIISLWPGIVKTEVVNDLKKKLEKYEENDVSMMKKRVNKEY